MISKGEAIQRLKKMGVVVADNQSIVTILLPAGVSLSAGIKDIKEKLKNMDYDASFCIRQSNAAFHGENAEVMTDRDEVSEQEISAGAEETVTEEDLSSSLLSMDDDGQFSLGGFGLDF